MGKKRVIKQNESEAIAETKKVEGAIAKAEKKEESAKRSEFGRVYINITYNNTVITVTDRKGNVVGWASAGSLGFSGPKKATPFAASKAVAAIAEKIKRTGPFNVDVIVRGVGGGRDSSIRSLASHGFNLLSITDVTPIPHNGPMPRKPRRM